MLPRRRNIGGLAEKGPAENEFDSYSKLDKKGNSYNSKPYITAPSVGSNNAVASFSEDIIFDILEEFVFEPVMAARDRTNEFISTVRGLQDRIMARPAVRDKRKAAVLETYSQFMSMAKVISKNITSTYAKLEKLALCKYFLSCRNISLLGTVGILQQY